MLCCHCNVSGLMVNHGGVSVPPFTHRPDCHSACVVSGSVLTPFIRTPRCSHLSTRLVVVSRTASHHGLETHAAALHRRSHVHCVGPSPFLHVLFAASTSTRLCHLMTPCSTRC
jgi:hypothetical protein